METRGPTRRTSAWWLSLARGLVALLLGVSLLVAGAGQSRLATFIAVYWLLGAVLTLRWARKSRERVSRRLAMLAAGIGLIAALVLLARRPIADALGTAAVIDIVGVGAIVTGALRMLGGFREDALVDGRPRRRNGVVVGSLDIGLGLALVLASDATSTWVRIVAAGWGIAAGSLLLYDALRLRRSVRAGTEAEPGPARTA
jgi:uncharacterized membrane protein HdeD (DUF308 family)